MLAVSPLRNGNNEIRESEMESFSMEGNDFPDFTDGINFLDNINFDDLFANEDGDLLPDLEMDPEILAEFSISNGGMELEMNVTSSSASIEKSEDEINSSSRKEDQEEINGGSYVSVSRPWNLIQERVPVNSSSTRKSLARSKNHLGKRKMKVDWTPELHRRFVLAVEQLGVDKAVPSRILELMGIDCLTRHNIASHLQKYRSHRKHMLAREAEAANWNQRRQIYGSGGGVVAVKRDPSWNNIAPPPTMGFPPPPPPPIMHAIPHNYINNRPLMHVWGHPPSLVDMWLPKHLAPAPPPPNAWPPSPPPPPPNPSFWHSHHHVPKPGTPCFPQHLTPMRFPPPAPPLAGIPPPPMYKLAAGPGPGPKLPRPPCHVHPSKESVDAAVEDVLSKPWLPLPLGLKPPSIDSVMVELQSQGLRKLTPTCA